MLNMTYFTFPLFFILLWLVVFCSFCVAYGLCYCVGIKTKNKTEPVLSTTKQIQETQNFKINLTLLILWSWKIVPGCKLKHFTVLSTVQKYDKSPKTSFSVSAVLASLNLVLWIPNLHPCDSGAGWWMIEAPHPSTPNFHSSIWRQHYLLWQTLAVCGVSPHWCRNGMDAESALCERQTSQKIEQPNNQFV